MSKNDQPFLPQADKPEVQVRRSYYTFSKEYPRQRFPLKKPKKSKKSAGKFFRIAALVLCFVILVGGAYFATDLLLRVSEKPLSEEPSAQTTEIPTDLTHLKAMFVSHEVLSGKRAMKACIRTLKKNDCNGVVIDFKTADGFLVYTSAELIAIQSNSNLYDTHVVQEALSMLQKAGIQVFAGVHCFDDARLAAYDTRLAVKYLDTDVSWLNAPEEAGGLPQVNPYATDARAYLKAVISEITAFGVNGVVLKGVSFPVGEAADTATFPGEEASVKRNKLLKNLIHSIKGEMPEDCALLLSVDAVDIAGNETRYDGSIFPNECDAVLCNTANRPSIELNEEDGYMSAISLYHQLIGETNASTFILEIPNGEATAAYLRALNRNGYASVVIDE